MLAVGPSLFDLIVTWLREELPLAEYDSEVRPAEDGVIFKPRIERHIFKIKDGWGNTSLTLALSPGSMLMSRFIEDAFAIGPDYVITGKWTKGVRLVAADPQFFGKLAYYMTHTAKIVTMGDFPTREPAVVRNLTPSEDPSEVADAEQDQG